MTDKNAKDSSAGSPFSLPADEFRALGHALVDRIADYHAGLGDRELTRLATPDELQALLGDPALPDAGSAPGDLLDEIVPMLFDQSLHNGHPKFMGYITSSAAPLGALADFLASSLNANLGRWDIAPMASEIEARAVRWISELIGYETSASGILASGGNMANFTAFVAARTAKLPWDVRQQGNYADSRRPTAYVSAETHTWVQKAADVCGIGAEGIRWIPIDAEGRLDLRELRRQIASDRSEGRLPFFVVGTAGTVSLGVVDPLRELAELCAEEDVWFHVDGAYGAPAALLPEAPPDLHALGLADSVAVDPHKWLYCPIEVACVLTRHPDALRSAFSFRPDYYRLDGRKMAGTDYYELGMQNTRGFRGLKVWLMLRAAGKDGYREAIRSNVRLAQRLYDRVKRHPDFTAHAVHLSIATFRFVPRELAGDDSEGIESYLDRLNQALLAELQAGGEMFLSNAVVDGAYLLRACIVNFRTTETDVDEIPEMIADLGRRLDRQLRAS